MTEWQEMWDECFGETKERQPTFDPEDYYRSGRASKDWPDKETPEWWAINGPKFVKSWQVWRKNSGLKIWEFPDDNGELQPGIEAEVWAYNLGGNFDNDLVVKSVIDRVMWDPKTDDYFIVDLKCGSHTQPWPLQLALNNLCLYATHGVRAKWGGFWKARTGSIHPKWFDLSIYTDDWLWDQVAKAKEIRDRQLFMANPNNLCTSACGVREYCVAMGGTPFFPVDATLTHNGRNAK